ncbi:MAG: class I SAM-dependent methyltransferase [Desulfobacterales bacterium]|jgi:2-polyprenyl-3-methyl-5-hydroxy-6-metoxy-1,4-benzoquinol methylase|nr:class I SAM-dependent methyltransferase [Desulfobacterales bacterium]
MTPFFQVRFNRLIDSPNQSRVWWHSLPLPDGNRINGVHPDKDLQFKIWRAMQIPEGGGLDGKSVLDIGANDGFFTLAAIMAGAREVTAVDMNWETWPRNIRYAGEVWQVKPRIVTADFRAHDFPRRYDVIFFLGVLYHLEDVFGGMKTLSRLLADDGVIYLETQMSQVKSDLPVFEYASDIYPTIAPQDKKFLSLAGISNYLFPNEPAVRNLAHSYDFRCDALDGAENVYTLENPHRRIYKLTRI